MGRVLGSLAQLTWRGGQLYVWGIVSGWGCLAPGKSGRPVARLDDVVDETSHVVPGAWCWVAEVFSTYAGHDDRSVLVGIQQRTSSVGVERRVTPFGDTAPTAPVSLSLFARECPPAAVQPVVGTAPSSPRAYATP